MAGIPYATPGEYPGRPHPIGCRCADSGQCEWRQLVAEERAEKAHS